MKSKIKRVEQIERLTQKAWNYTFSLSKENSDCNGLREALSGLESTLNSLSRVREVNLK